MSPTEGPTTVAVMLAQLLADFEDGLAVDRLEHALGRLRRGETERVIDASSDSERPAEDSSP